MRLPYRILIADGQVNDAVARYIENSRDVFPELDIEYIRYADDTDLRQYFAKMSDALARVTTRYVMLADNDDFLGYDGIEQALDFLDANEDYVCARGQIKIISVRPDFKYQDGAVCGRINSIQASYKSEGFSSPSAAERLEERRLDLGLYYAIYRSEAAVTIWREVKEINFSDLMLHETFYALRTLTLGKVHVNKETVSYCRQLGTSLTYQPSQDWARHLVRSRFTSEVEAIVKNVSAAAVMCDGRPRAVSAENVRITIEEYFSWFLSTNYGWLSQLKRRIRFRWPSLSRHFQNRPRFVGFEREAYFRRMLKAGATHESLARLRKELKLIEVALSSKTFAQFAGPFLSTAGTGRSRDWL